MAYTPFEALHRWREMPIFHYYSFITYHRRIVATHKALSSSAYVDTSS